MIYLDNATATPLSPQAQKEMLSFLQEKFESPYAPYSTLTPQMNKYLDEVKALIGATEKDRFLISPSVTISTNAIFYGVWQDIAKEYGKNHFLSTCTEEAAKLFCLGRIEEMGGITTLLPVSKNGVLEPKDLIEGLSPRSALLSISLVHPILGTIQPMEEIGKICQERGVLLHVDLTHAIGKIEFNLKEMQADFATFSCESIFGPKSCSVLWMRQGVKLSPQILGSEPETIGSLDPASFAALGIASQEARENQQSRMLETARLRSLFEKDLQEKIPESSILFKEARLACTSVVLFPYIPSETLLYAISEKGVYACMGGGTRQEIGHLIGACGIDSNLAKCALSFTFSYMNTEEEVLKASEIIAVEFRKYQTLSKGLF